MIIDQHVYPEGAMFDLLGTNTECHRVDIGKHGFISLLDVMPRVVPVGRTADYAIARAARVSTGQSTKSVEEDTALIRYLMRHRHSSPFEMVEFQFNVSLPIFLARQWIRHRTANVNEISARYTELPDDYWLPGEWRRQGTSNRQGGEEPLAYEPNVYSAGFQNFLLDNNGDPNVEGSEDKYHNIYPWKGSVEDVAFHEYQRRLHAGVSREMARSCLPVSVYTRWYWKCDLHNIFNFLSLRLDSHAQTEIREYAQAMLALITPLVPEAVRAFRDYRLGAVTLSRLEVEALRAEISGLRRKQPVTQGLATRNHRENDEWRTKRKLLGLP
jgi:thymidylate synthase (FAD)